MKHLRVFWVAFGAFALGVVVGGLARHKIGMRKEELEIKRKLSSSEMDRRDLLNKVPLTTNPKESSEDVAKLRSRILELEAQAAAASRKDESDQFAREVLEGLTKPLPDPNDMSRAIKCVVLAGTLKPEMSSYFIDRLNNPEYQENRAILIKLIMTCAGTPAAGVLKDLLRRQGIAADERDVMIESLLGGDYGHHREPRIPIDDELRVLAEMKLCSLDTSDRELGVAVLAQDPTNASRTRLETLVKLSPGAGIDLVAIKALAMVGDQTTLNFFENLIGGVPEQWPLDKPVISIEDSRKWQITNAYEIIRGRLHR